MSKMIKTGQLARENCQKSLPLAVLKSQAGFYIGTFDDEGPCSRESQEYYRTEALAQVALDTNNFTQKDREIYRGFHPQDSATEDTSVAKKSTMRPR